jgi:molybdopterin synthase subunit MoaD
VSIRVRLVYLARFRERFGLSSETYELAEDENTVADLLQTLRQRGGAFAEELAPARAWRVAVNQEMAELDSILREGDEVALFPPVTGG